MDLSSGEDSGRLDLSSGWSDFSKERLDSSLYLKDSTADDSIATQEIGVRKAQVQGEVKKEEYDPDVK